MTMKRIWITRNAPAWAAFGSYGWRPCTVLDQADERGRVEVRFETGSRGRGTRTENRLRPRDPALGDRDKPTPAEAAACATGYQQALRETLATLDREVAP
jgi:hypothetical protein